MSDYNTVQSVTKKYFCYISVIRLLYFYFTWFTCTLLCVFTWGELSASSTSGSGAVGRGRAGSNWDEEIGCNLICRELPHYFIASCALKKYDKNIREWKKHDLRLCNLADIIQSFCWGPNSCLTPVYTSYCISNLGLGWLLFEEAVLKSHSSFPSQTANYFYSRETCDFGLGVGANHLQTTSWGAY